MKSKSLSKLLAYVYMPVIFSVLGYGILRIALAPVVDMAEAVGSMVIASEIPDFNPDLVAAFDPEAARRLAEENQRRAAEAAKAEEEFDPNVISVDDVDFPANGTYFARLTCEKIGLDAPLYWGDTNKILKNGAGQFMGSFLPGFGRPILISAHNTTYFKPLQYTEVGDIITCQTNYGIYEYEVTEVTVEHVRDFAGNRNEMLSAEEETLILYTCYPFYAIAGTKNERLIVYGTRISGPDVQ